MKAQAFIFKNKAGFPLLTDGRRVFFDATPGAHVAKAFGSPREIAETQALWEKRVKESLTPVPAGTVEYLNI